MNEKELKGRRHAIMEALEQGFVREMIPAKLVMDENLGVETLAVIMEDFAAEGQESTGEFFFMPTGERDDLQIFCNAITIAEELSGENRNELFNAVMVINAITPVGCFIINPESGALVYKHNYEIPLALDQNVVKMLVDACMSAAFKTVEQMAYLLIDVNEGTRTAQNVIDTLCP